MPRVTKDGVDLIKNKTSCWIQTDTQVINVSEAEGIRFEQSRVGDNHSLKFNFQQHAEHLYGKEAVLAWSMLRHHFFGAL